MGLRRGFLTKIAVLIAVTLGSMVLAGWLWGIRPLTSLIPNYAAIKPNTAFRFVVGGLSLWLLRLPSIRANSAHPINPRWGQICAFRVAFVGLVTLGEYCLKLNFGIDEMLLRDAWTDLRVSPAGRMSMATAFGFFMLGSSLFFLGRKNSQDAKPGKSSSGWPPSPIQMIKSAPVNSRRASFPDPKKRMRKSQ
jgi:hypothetical protein